MNRLLTFLLFLLLTPVLAAPLPSVAEKTAGLQKRAGFFNLYWSASDGKLYWEIGRINEEFLYQISLATGLGSNPVGLDRGQIGGTHLLTPKLLGNKILLYERNLGFRALTKNVDERRAVAEAFAPAVHWGFELVAQTGDRYLVDATDFFQRDAHRVASTLKSKEQGTWRVDESRSSILPEETRCFPKNSEIETLLTFTSDQPGREVRKTAAFAHAISLRQHHSLVELPKGYQPVPADPRVGTFSVDFLDYAKPLGQDMKTRYAVRHRLDEPLVYYLDRGVPEPIRSALMDGASWWAEAFEAAGYPDHFKVKLLPPGVDPMDLRYNVIHWTHRSTRGWSYGYSVVDPRTGEILKGNVNLGSLRVRQDIVLARPLANACQGAQAPNFAYLEAGQLPDASREMALARLRQLAAHEVGHTLGFEHNFFASTRDRASVMDYPAPKVVLKGESFDLSEAYDAGIGEYDKFATRWLYGHFASESQRQDFLLQGLAAGHRCLPDADARARTTCHPKAALWDNGDDPLTYLEHEYEVRRRGLSKFGSQLLSEKEPLAQLEEVLVPLYLHHRYQLEAAIKSLGGVDYSLAYPGDGQKASKVVSPARQRKALNLALKSLEPDFLALPEELLGKLVPPPYSHGEVFPGNTGRTFDALGACRVSANLTCELLLEPSRLTRLAEFHARDPLMPGPGEVVDSILASTWGATAKGSYHQAILREVRLSVLESLLTSASDAPDRVRVVLERKLENMAHRFSDSLDPEKLFAWRRIRGWQRSKRFDSEQKLELPAGSPIGQP